MRRIGLRELNQNPSRIIDQVRRGVSIELTDRGRPVARLVPVAGDPVLERLVESGRARPASVRGPVPLPPPLGDRDVSAAEAIVADRAADRG